MENIFNHNGFDLTSEEVKLLADSSAAIYQREGSEFLVNNILVEQGWENITDDLAEKVNEDGLFVGSSGGLIDGEGVAGVFKKDNTVILAFRGTDSLEDVDFWFARQAHYDLFDELITNLDTYVENEENGIFRVLATGHSLGGAMTEIFLENHNNTENTTYSAVTIASPTAGELLEFPPGSPDRRILNIGYQNDSVYGATELGNVNSEVSTTGIYIDIDGARNTLDFGFPFGNFLDNPIPGLQLSIQQPHHQDHYAYTVNRIIDSKYYEQIQKNSPIIIDRSDSPVEASMYTITSGEKSFILGEDESNENNGNDVLVGSNRSEIIEGLGGNDEIIGDNFVGVEVESFALEDTLDGGTGNDILEGGADNDSLDGGDDNDKAVFSDNFENYKYEIDPTTEEITFTHVEGTQTDGSDTLTNVEFAQFSDRLVPLPLEDGPEDTEEADILNADGGSEGTASLTLPTYTYDGDAEYTFTLSTADTSSLYNFAFIIDTSGSMDTNDDGTPNNKLTNAKAAYTNLTNYLTEEDIASEFAVIPFNNSASLSDSLDATQTISTINGLSAGGDTNFNAALAEANSFFNSANPNATNIAYFLSDGMNTEGDFSANAAELQGVADVRAFGIGDADIGQLNTVDSNTAVLLSDSSDLEEEFTTASGFPLDEIERVDIIVDTDANDNTEGAIVETIQPDRLIDSPSGLQFTESIEGLDVAIDAENLVTAEVVFNDGRPNTTVDFTVTAGQGIGSATDGDDDIRMGATDTEIDAGAGNDKVLGNYLDNTIAGGSGNDELIASDGDDTIIPGEGDDLIDGGEGIDTAVYSGTREEEGGIKQVSDFIEVGGNTDTLIDVEFVEFADVTVSTDDLSVVTDNEESSIIDGTDDNDTLTGSSKDEVINGYKGDDLIYGSDGADSLKGSDGNDTMYGGAGKDYLVGGKGSDLLFDDAGDDIFYYSNINQSLPGEDMRDRVGLNVGEDRIELKLIDANPDVAGDQAFEFIGTDSFSNGSTGQVRYDASSNLIQVEVYGDGDTIVDMEIESHREFSSLSEDDFIL